MGANVQVSGQEPTSPTSPDLPPTSPGGGGKLQATSPDGRVSAPRRYPPGGGQQAGVEGRTTSPKDSGEVTRTTSSWCLKCAELTDGTADQITVWPHDIVLRGRQAEYRYEHHCGNTWTIWRRIGGTE